MTDEEKLTLEYEKEMVERKELERKKIALDQEELRQIIEKMTPKQVDEYLDLLEQESIIKARTNYIDYNRYVHPNWKDTKLSIFLCDKVEQLLNGELLTEDGEEADYLLLSCPPQSGKSLTVTETIGSYVLGKRKFKDRIYERIIALAYGEDLARKFGKRNLNKVAEYGKKIFNIELDPNSKSVTDFDILGTNRSMISRGIMAGVTGNAGELILVDDPFKNMEDAMSESYREKVFEEFLASVESRLSARGKVIIIHTRWHPDDLIGRVIDNKAFRAVYYNFPLEAEENDPLNREIGQALVPEIGKDNDWLAKKKAIYMQKEGQRSWFALYQGRPQIEGGNIVKREWFERYSYLPPMGLTIMSVDATFKDEKNSDFVSIQIWGKANNKIYLIDKVTERMGFNATVQKIKDLKALYPQVSAILIEDKANGSAIIETLRKQVMGVIAVNPKGGKYARFEAVSPFIASGNVYLPENKAWVHDFIEQCVGFPNVKHDDDVDSMSQALKYLEARQARMLTEAQQESRERQEERYGNMVKRYGGTRATKNYINYGR